MGLETPTYFNDFVVTNPAATDLESQGDDHLRNIKTAAKNTFPNATKPFYLPDATAKSANFTVTAAHQNQIFYVDTSGGNVAATLPTLTSGDTGWECSFLKTGTDTNAIFITPASGTLQSGDLSGLAKTRRAIPGVPTKAIWTGTAWYCTRAVSVPVGSIIPLDRSTLPVGYEWPNGQTLSGASGSVYPDFFAAKASLVVVDIRGRGAFGKDDMGGSAASRITTAVSGVDGLTLGAAGGAQSVVMVQANLPVVNFTGTLPDHTHTTNVPQTPGTYQPSAGGFETYAQSGLSAKTSNAGSTSTPAISVSSGGSATAMNKLPPALILNQVLVVE